MPGEGRERILSLIVKLFAVSCAIAGYFQLKLLGLIEAEVKKTDDILATLSIMELLCEVTTCHMYARNLISLYLDKPASAKFHT